MEIKSYVSKEFFHQAGGNSIIILIVSQPVTQKRLKSHCNECVLSLLVDCFKFIECSYEFS